MESFWNDSSVFGRRFLGRDGFRRDQATVRPQGTGLNGAKLRGYGHLNRNLNPNPNLDLNLLMEEALAKPCSGGLRPPKLPAKRESAVGDRRYRTGFCKRLGEWIMITIRIMIRIRRIP